MSTNTELDMMLYQEDKLFREMPHVTYQRMRTHLGRFYYEYNVEILIKGVTHRLKTIKPEHRNKHVCSVMAGKILRHLLDGKYLNMVHWEPV